MDPFKLYIYDDGLVRIATEEYTEDLDKIQDCCIHVCNYAVNSKNTEKFIVNNNPDLCEGHKVRESKILPMKFDFNAGIFSGVLHAFGLISLKIKILDKMI